MLYKSEAAELPLHLVTKAGAAADIPNTNWLPSVEPVDIRHSVPMFIDGLDPNELQFIAIEGREALSQLGEATVMFDYPDAELDSKKLLRTKVAVFYDVKGKMSETEYQKAFTGLIWDLHKPFAQYLNPSDNKTYYRYQARIVPKLYFLQYHVDSRIFVGQTIQQILNAILKDEHGLTPDDFVLDLEGIATTFKLPECIQYQESDWVFIQRLLMKAGIYFYLEHDAAGGNIKHVMHFTDKKPQTLAKKPSQLSLSKPNYYGGNQSYNNGSQDWIACYNWRSVDCAMMESIAVDGFDPLKPTQVLMSQQKIEPGVEITKHPNFGHYRPQQGYSVQSDGKAFAEVALNQYQAFKMQSQVSFNVPGLSVMQKFTIASLDTQHFKDCAFGVVEGDYLVFETVFKISLLGNGRGYAAPEFTTRVIPLTDSTPAPCPYFNLPAAPVTQTKLHAVVCNDKGAYDDDAVEQSNRMMNNDNMRGLYVAFPQWDQQKRTNKKENLTPVPVQYFAPPGFSALPMVGSWCLVEFLAFDQAPLFVGTQHNSAFKPYEEDGANAELTIMAQPVKASDNENVNSIMFKDGSKIDDQKTKQLMDVYAPGKFILAAAQGSKDAKAVFSIDEEGNISLGNDSGASIQIKKNGDLMLLNKKVSITMTAEGDFTVDSQSKVGFKATQDINFETQAKLNAKSTADMTLEATGQFNAAGSVATIKAQGNINLTAGGMVNST